MIRRGLGRVGHGRDGHRPNDPVIGGAKAHSADQALQYLDRVPARIDIHVKDAGLQRFGQFGQARLAKIMLDEDLFGLRPRQGAHIGGVDAAIAVQVHPQGLHRADGDAKVGGPARIVGVVHVPAFAGHDLTGNLFDAWHDTPMSDARPGSGPHRGMLGRCG